MKKWRLPAAVALSGILLVACQGGGKTTEEFDPQESCVYVTANGEIFSALIYTSAQDNDAYEEEELRTYVQDAVAEYNASSGADAAAENVTGDDKLPVSLQSCELEGSTGKLIFEYADGEAFTGFARASGDDSHTITQLKVTTVGDGLPEGEIDHGFSTSHGNEVLQEEVKRQTDAWLAVVEGSGLIRTDRQIRYVTKGAEVLDDYHVRVPEGTNYIVFQ